jgi:hypothetical protein
VIRAEIRDVDDFKARKIVLSENIQRVDLTPIEEINAFAEWVDVLMCEDTQYAKIDKPPVERLSWVLMKLNNADRRGENTVSNNFIRQIESAFSSLPRPVEWQSFYINDLKPYLKMDEDVKEVAIEQFIKLHVGMADRWIAEQVGRNRMTIGRYRKQLEATGEIESQVKRTGSDGKGYSGVTNVTPETDKETIAVPVEQPNPYDLWFDDHVIDGDTLATGGSVVPPNETVSRAVSASCC